MSDLTVLAKVEDDQHENIVFEEAEFDIDTKGLWTERDEEIIAHFPHGAYLNVIVVE